MIYSIFAYINYCFKRKKSAHSPFVYKFIVEVLQSKTNNEQWRIIERERQRLLKNHNKIHVLDLGVKGRKNGLISNRSIRSITAKSCKNAKTCRILSRIVEYFACKNIVELGTATGMSAAYMAVASPTSQVLTIEGCPEIAKIAGEVFQNIKTKNIEIINADFDYAIEHFANKFENIDLLFIDGNHDYEPTIRYFNFAKKYAKEDTIFIFDDIHWSKNMNRAWQEVKQDKQVKITIDLFNIGIVFFKDGLSKQDFML